MDWIHKAKVQLITILYYYNKWNINRGHVFFQKVIFVILIIKLSAAFLQLW